MEENFKEKTKFVDNVAYKSKFQFLIWVNDNVICQRYFKINGFNEESVHTEEFNNCMNGIVDSIKEDLVSKSRIFMWYSNLSEPMKATGFLSQEEVEKYGEDFLGVMTDTNIVGKIEAPDGKVFTKEYISLCNEASEYGETERPNDDEFIFKFSFLIDDVPVFEKVWDGNVYPKFVRNGVDLTNNYAFYDNKDNSSLSFGAMIIRCMQKGKTNLISDFIRRICDTLSNTYSDKYEYTKVVTAYKNNNKINKDRYETAVEYYGGVIKPVVTGHTEIKPETKNYNYLSAIENYKQSWKKYTRKKTQEYFDNLYPSNRQIEYIDKNL